MNGGEGAMPWLPLACLLGEGTLASVLWWWPDFLFRYLHAGRRPRWWRLALLRPLCRWGQFPLCCLLAPLLPRIEHVGDRVLLYFVLSPVMHHAMAFPGRVFWALLCPGASGPLLRLVRGAWTLPSTYLGPKFVVVLDVLVAPLHVPWWRFHALRVLDSGG
jgi:hypothetical protein